MHDKDAIRKDPEAFKAALNRRNIENVDALVKDLLEKDAADRGGKTVIQTLQAKANEIAKQIPVFKKEGKDIAPLLAEGKALKEKIAAMEGGEGGKFDEALMVIPNILAADVPAGADETGNKELRVVGKKPDIKGAKDHVALGEGLGLMDFESAAKISGARFVVLKGELARLERALANFMLDLHTNEFGYQENIVPLLVRSDTLRGTGQLPKFEDDLFSTKKIDKSLDAQFYHAISSEIIGHINALSEKYPNYSAEQIEAEFQKRVGDILPELKKSFDDEFTKLWLIPTSEVSLTNIVREEILDEKKLPMRMTAWTPCFRSEAGAAGKDTRGMIRQHQFSKVELVSITTPEQSEAEHERMVGCAEEVLKRLGLHYRVMLLCAGDTGFSARKTYDIEVWLPGQNTFREISSCSNCGDFQARRMKARYRKGEKETAFVHTLNGSGLAVGRTLIAVMETYQNDKGGINIPEVLQPYMGNKKVIGPQ